MKFTNPEVALSEEEISTIELQIGIRLPPELRYQYLQSNGGYPELYVYEDYNLDTVVSQYLPLKSVRGMSTAVDTYLSLVLTKMIVALNFFPFAVDGGGDYFFVDCSSPFGAVYFYKSDTFEKEVGLLPLEVSIKEFWSRLKAE